ncbi:MAG: D-glycero-beta-D-manno-heptose-7-phosphate kinase [Promethearchaeota archaeon]
MGSLEGLECLEGWVDRVRNVHVGVVGDAAIDKYVEGSTTRMSPDAPVPVVDVKSKRYYLGALGLVVQQLLSFGAQVTVASVVGSDFEGEFFVDKLGDMNLGLKGVVRVEGFTPQVTRVKSRGQHMLRLEKRYDFSPDQAEKTRSDVLRFVDGVLERLDALVLLDYGMGMFQGQNRYLSTELLKLASKRGVPTVARPSRSGYEGFSGVTLAKVNLRLACSMVGVADVNQTSVRIVGNKLLNDVRCRALFLPHVDGTSYLFRSNSPDPVEFASKLKYHGTSYVGVGSAIMATMALGAAARLDDVAVAKLAHLAGSLSALCQPVTFFTVTDLDGALRRDSLDRC